jgi:hypothetical protein
MLNASLSIVLGLLDRIDIDTSFIKTMVKSCYEGESGKKQLKNAQVKVIVESVLKKCKTMEDNVIKMMDREVYLVSLKIGEGVTDEESPYLK